MCSRALAFGATSSGLEARRPAAVSTISPSTSSRATFQSSASASRSARERANAAATARRLRGHAAPAAHSTTPAMTHATAVWSA
jgi:hypothetical protein